MKINDLIKSMGTYNKMATILDQPQVSMYIRSQYVRVDEVKKFMENNQIKTWEEYIHQDPQGYC